MSTSPETAYAISAPIFSANDTILPAILASNPTGAPVAVLLRFPCDETSIVIHTASEYDSPSPSEYLATLTFPTDVASDDVLSRLGFKADDREVTSMWNGSADVKVVRSGFEEVDAVFTAQHPDIAGPANDGFKIKFKPGDSNEEACVTLDWGQKEAKRGRQ